MTAPRFQPAQYHSLVPYLLVPDAESAIESYKKVFGGRLNDQYNMPDGKIGHAELKVGDFLLMLAEEMPERGFKSP